MVTAWQRQVAVLVAAAFLIVAAALQQASDVQREVGGLATVVETVRACPIATNKASIAAGQLRANEGAKSSAAALAAEEVPGELLAGELDALEAPGQWTTSAISSKIVDAVALRYRDDEGAGFVAFTSAATAKSAGGGRAVAECPTTEQVSWFVGVGSSSMHQSRLVLTNIGDTPAVADVRLWSEKGVVEVVDGEGIVVDPMTSRTIDVEDLAAGEDELAMAVRAQRGAIVASVYDRSTSVFEGSSWIPPAREPARKFTVGGVPAGAADRTLIVVNPGSTTANITVEVIGKEGTIAVEDFKTLKVGAQRIVTFDVPASVGKDGFGMRFSSDQKVTASMRISPTDEDYAYAVSRVAESGPIIVPIALGKPVDALGRTVILTPAGSGTNVTIEAFDTRGKSLGVAERDVPIDRTLIVDLLKNGLFASSESLTYVALTANEPLHAALVAQDDSNIAIVPLRAVPLTIPAPSVTPERTAIG